jgi:hypothetical protein
MAVRVQLLLRLVDVVVVAVLVVVVIDVAGWRTGYVSRVVVDHWLGTVCG